MINSVKKLLISDNKISIKILSNSLNKRNQTIYKKPIPLYSEFNSIYY